MPRGRKKQFTKRQSTSSHMRTLRVGDLTVRYNEEDALEAYRRIRAGSLIGGMFTRAAFAQLAAALGPDWREKVFASIGSPGEMEEEADVDGESMEARHH